MTPRTRSISLQVLTTVAVMLVALGCGSSPVPVAGGPSAPASTAAPSPAGTTSLGTNAVTLVQFSEANPGAAAQRELELTREMREDAGMAALIGENGPAAFASLDELLNEYGQEVIQEMAAAIDAGEIPTTEGPSQSPAGTVAAIGGARLSGGSALNAIDVSLYADTAFMGSVYMSLATELVKRAADNQSGTWSKQESVPEQTIDGLTHKVDLGTSFPIRTGDGRVTADLILTATDRITDAATGSFVALYTSRTTAHFDVSACPDENGIAEGTYTFETTQELNDVSTTSASRSGANRAVESPFRLINGDHAHLQHIEATLDLSADGFGPGSPTGPGPTAPFDWDAAQVVQIVMPVSGATTVTGISATVTGTGGERASGAMLLSSAMAQLFMGEVGKKAEEFWRSGKCIEIKTSKESRDVSPGETVEFTAEAEAKFGDRAKVMAPIKAAFNGKESLDPVDEPKPPPVTFNFTAGSEQGDKGTIDLEQVGKRGIGKKQLVFTVAATDYRVVNAQTQIGGVSGTKCDGLAGPWTLQWHGQGATGTTTFTLPEGGGSAPAHTDLTFDFGQAKSVYVLDGSASVTVRDDGVSALLFTLGSGTVTVSAKGQSQTVNVSYPTTAYDLETGDFCQ